MTKTAVPIQYAARLMDQGCASLPCRCWDQPRRNAKQLKKIQALVAQRLEKIHVLQARFASFNA